MEYGDTAPGGVRPVVVRVPVEPVEAAAEADAADAALRNDKLVVRGPLFGIAAQSPADGAAWRVICPVVDDCPQLARDGLNSRLWFRAKDADCDREMRQLLLSAVARLETERVDDLSVGGTRYRVIRAEEYAVADGNGIEGPRPTDPEPLVPDWDRATNDPRIDDGLVLDPYAAVPPSQALERLALRDLHYTGDRFPDHVRADSEQALFSHPDVLLLPATFTVVEQHAGGWTPSNGPHATAHAARKSLHFALTWFWPRKNGLIAYDADPQLDAETSDAPELAPYAEAAAALRAGGPHANRLEFAGGVHQLCRTRRLVRWGPDGPEGPRPSDVNSQDPAQLHPRMDEDGNVLSETVAPEG